MSKYVDLDSLIDEVRKTTESIGEDCDRAKADALISFLENLQPEEFSPPAKAKVERMTVGFGNYWRCSRCKAEIINTPDVNFCCYCGASFKEVR